VPGAEWAVGGWVSAEQAFTDDMHDAMPIVATFVLLVTFVVLLVTLRSARFLVQRRHRGLAATEHLASRRVPAQTAGMRQGVGVDGEVNEAVAAEVLQEVASAAAAEAGGVDAALLDDYLQAATLAVATGSRLARRDLGRYRSAGARAAREGVALRALVDLYLSASWRLWRHLPPVLAASQDPDGVVRAGEALLRAADDAVAALTEGYQLERQSVVRLQAAARREFVDDLLGGGADVAGLVMRGDSLGLDLAGPHAVLVVKAQKPFTDGTPVTGLIERALRGSKGDAGTLVATKEDRLVVVFAAPDRAAVRSVVDSITSVLAPVRGGRPVALHRQAGVGDWQVGVGRPHVGPAGVRASYDEARDALVLAERLGQTTPVVDAEDQLVLRVLLRDEPAMVDLIRAVLVPLAAARGGAAPLVQTLAAYFDSGANAAAAARALHLSVRALTYRLARVAELTGHDPADPAHRFTLQAAVTGARLLGWPDRPLPGGIA
jgi:sugar diacid utilization regulator